MILIDERWIALYFAAYGLIAGIWNMAIVKWSTKVQEKLLNTDGGLDLCIKYAQALESAWMCRIIQEPAYAPLMTALCVLFWPVYLPASAITSVWLIHKYLRPKVEMEAAA